MTANDILTALIFGWPQNIEKLSSSGGASDSGKVLAVGSDGKVKAIILGVGEGEIALDKDLTVDGAAADAKSVGDAITLTSAETSTLTGLLN